jgi:hypothetical protein
LGSELNRVRKEKWLRVLVCSLEILLSGPIFVREKEWFRSHDELKW